MTPWEVLARQVSDVGPTEWLIRDGANLLFLKTFTSIYQTQLTHNRITTS